MGHRPTIVDVAKAAGVSKVTVSYVLNGHGSRVRISEPTRARVMEAARTLGYTPNAIARMMVTKRCSTLGVVFQYAQYFTVWSTFTNEVMLGICQATVQQGYDLLLHTGSLDTSRSEADALSDGRVDGVLALRDNDDETLSELLRRPLPTVLFFTRSDDPSVSFVDADNFMGGRIATEHLIGLGHKKIGMIHGTEHSTSSVDRHRGFNHAMESAGLEIDPDLVLSIPNLEECDSLIQLLKSDKRPTALVCWSDDAAFCVLKTAAQLDISVPEQLSVIGFDSLQACEYSTPRLTSIKQPVREIAKTATELLIAIAKQEDPGLRQIVFPVEFEERESTAPPPN